ncbi:AzlC family ABC transporter permease [Micrococcus lylae]|uniref:AzlC family ABC transporter permease n=1 Tax=Micrococcus lylae TaxID=1273 RepID=UPI000C80FAA7|nr:AzlC family ABC transporter permease [Micrococcus lylae]WIK82720.1 AzlC family ABC transporter permease [Micrococcus lylae]
MNTDSALTAATVSTSAEVRRGLRLSSAAGLGLVPLGVAFGLLVAQAPLPWWTAPLLSTVVFAGSVELLLVSLIVAGTPLVSVAVTVFLLNFRHVFYAFSFPLRVVRSRPARLYSMGALIDEAYAIATTHRTGWTGPRLLAMQAALQVYWVFGGVVGVAAGSLLPAPIEGLEFALTALFIVLALDAARTRRQVPLVVMAAAAVVVGVAVAPGELLVTAFAVYVLFLIVAHLVARRGRDVGLPAEDPLEAAAVPVTDDPEEGRR